AMRAGCRVPPSPPMGRASSPPPMTASSDTRNWTLCDIKNWTPRLTLWFWWERAVPKSMGGPRTSRSDRGESGGARGGRSLWTLGGEPRDGGNWFGLARREAARRFDGADLVEVEIEDRLQRLAGSGVAERLGERLEPLRVFALQSDEFGHGIAPALMAAAAIGRTAAAGDAGPGKPAAQSGPPLRTRETPPAV